MKNNSKYLVVIVVVLSALSYFILKNKNTTNSDNSYLVAELQERVNDIDEIILSKGQETLQLYKDSGVWKVTEFNSFFADANKVAQLLLSLRELKLKQPKTSNAENYHRLGLSKDLATNVVLKEKDNVVSDFYIGKESSKGQGIYVLKKAQKQSWLATGSVEIKLDKKDWIVTNIIDVAPTAIQSVSYKSVEDNGFVVSKKTPNNEAFDIELVPDGKQLKAAIDLNTLANGLSKFTIDGALNNIELDEVNLKNTVSYQLFSGPKYSLKLYSQGEKYYAKITTQNSNSLSVIEKQLGDWIFTIPSYKFDALNKKISDIYEEAPASIKENEN